MQTDFCFSAIVRVTLQMHGERTVLGVRLLSEFPGPCAATVKSFSFIKKDSVQ